ncbi:MAG: hypothetical protein K2X82_13770 [Gemmataceae bacterium]|nr:hypothetical protein [Gemmataceae bacterium]
MRNFITFATLASTLFTGRAEGQQTYSVEQIKQAWQQRQDRIASVKMSYTEVRIKSKKSFELFRPRLANEIPPDADLTLPGRGSVSFDNARIKISTEYKNWSLQQGRLIDSKDESLFSDSKNLSIYYHPEHPEAEISKRSRPLEGSDYTFWPIKCYARGVNRTLTPLNLPDYEPTNGVQVVAGQRCMELVKSDREGSGRTVVLLDTARDFLPLRYLIVENGSVTFRLDIRYGPIAGESLAPVAWDYAFMTLTGSLIESKRVAVESLILNPQLSSDEFTLSIPPGTRVYDQFGGPAKRYVIRSDGVEGPSIHDDQHPTYEQLTQLAENRRRNTQLLLVAGFVVVAVAVPLLVFVVRRRRTGPAR